MTVIWLPFIVSPCAVHWLKKWPKNPGKWCHYLKCRFQKCCSICLKFHETLLLQHTAFYLVHSTFNPVAERRFLIPVGRGQVILLHFTDGQANHINSSVKTKTKKNIPTNNFESLFLVWVLRITVFFSSSEAIIFNRIFCTLC